MSEQGLQYFREIDTGVDQVKLLEIRQESAGYLVGENPDIWGEVSGYVGLHRPKACGIDFQHVEQMSSVGLQSMIHIHYLMSKPGERDGIEVVSEPPHIRELFICTKLDRLFNLHDSRKAFLASLSRFG